MVNKKKEKNFKKIFFNQKFITLVGLTVIFLISLPFIRNAVKQYKINQEINDLKKEISSLQNKNVDLKNFVSYLESEQFAEEQARLNLNLKKPGEELTVIKYGSENSSAIGTSSASGQIFDIPGYDKEKPKRELNNPEKWVNHFFN